jgi:FKBP-type peptidyl-prolyl cis-trans isomerase FklB
MKKLALPLMAVVAALAASCSGSAPKASFENDVDSLSYSLGLANSQGLEQYIKQTLAYQGVDTTDLDLDAFIKGLKDGASDDKKQAAYIMGLQIGQNISKQMVPGIDSQLSGNDSTHVLSLNNILAGLVAGLKNDTTIMGLSSAQHYAQLKMDEIKNANMEKQFGENRKASEAFMAKIAKADSVQSLGNGIYYKVLTAGTGATPAADARIKVNYEGKTIDGNVFDSSYQRNEPTTLNIDQTIPGWREALVKMPVGSKWVLYIPQEMAYGSRQTGPIKPYSALIFTVELVDIVTEVAK